MKYYGLDELDHHIAEVVSAKEGFFVELGAFDGVTQSNSLYFENLGWKGLLIEPVPEAYQKCCQNRPESLVVNCACVAEDYPHATVPMVSAGLMSIVEGARGSAEGDDAWVTRAEELQRLERSSVEVPARTLSSLLTEHDVKRVDLLLLDVEGYELAVLDGLDFAEHKPEYIVAEESKDDDRIFRYLESKGYTLIRTLSERPYTRDLLFHANRPLSISVYILSYNQQTLLKAAIESVLAQTVQPAELIIVDDASTDDSQALIRSYKKQYPNLIKPIFHDENRGISASRNRALSMVKGDLFTYLDGDDLFYERKLELELAAWRRAHDEKAVVFSNYDTLDPSGEVNEQWKEESLMPEGDVLTQVLERSFPKGRLFRYELIPTALLEKIGRYDTSLQVYEDWDLKIRLAQHGHFHFVDQSLSGYRRHDDNISKRRPVDVFKSFYDVLYKHRKTIHSMPEDTRIKMMDHWAETNRRYTHFFLRLLTGLRYTAPQPLQEQE